MKAAPEDNEVLIGEVTARQGLRGEVRVYPHTDSPERFATLKQIGVRQGEVMETRHVQYARRQGGVVILKLEGVDTPQEAEKLCGAQLFTSSEWLVPLEADEYYYEQVIGLEVFTTEGESLGRIEQILRTGANDVYETPLALIPAVKEYVIGVDLQGGRMTVAARPGLKKSDP